MADYNTKYQVTFDPPSGAPFAFYPRYRLEILQKDYTGTASNLTGAASAVVHEWSKDEPKAAVKGSSLSIKILNKDQTLPLSNFYSTDDDEFKVRLYFITLGLLSRPFDNLLFEGFLVQDDCSEVMVDYTHELNLSATDNLGLLKDVTLDNAPGSFSVFYSGLPPIEGVSSHVISILNTSVTVMIQPGMRIEVLTGGLVGTYTVVSVAGTNVTVTETVPIVASYLGSIEISETNLLDRKPLSEIVKSCLDSTGLELPTHIYCNIYEINHLTTDTFLQQTLVDPQTWNNGNETYRDCYEVLEDILERFRLSLFQANGVWNIVRWDELKYYSTNITGHAYDADFVNIGAVVPQGSLDIDIYDGSAVPDTYPETGLLNKIFRPDKLVKETFDYKQPEELLRNYNFQQVGKHRGTTTTGTGVNLQYIEEYEMKWWDAGFDWTSGGGGTITATADRFIRVVKDYLQNEIERYGVIKGSTPDNPSAAASYKIEANAGDVIKLSLSFRTNTSQPGPTNIVFDFNLVTQLPLAPIGANNRYLDDDGTWDSTIQFVYPIPSGTNLNEWQSVEVTSERIPFDGLLYIKLAQANVSNQETHYKDLRLEYIATINDSTKIIGHTHTNEHGVSVKQKEEFDLNVDSSPRNSIAGTLFLSTSTTILQDRTSQWLRGHMVTGGGLPMERRKLGDITTFEQLFWKRKARTILEGSFRGLLHGDTHITALTVFNYIPKPDLVFVPGRIEINYANDQFSATLWEIYETGEVDADLTSDYEFKYLYDTK